MVADTQTLREGMMILHDKQRMQINNLKRQNDLLEKNLEDAASRNARLMSEGFAQEMQIKDLNAQIYSLYNEMLCLAYFDRMYGDAPPSSVKAIERLLTEGEHRAPYGEHSFKVALKEEMNRMK